jgi:hypothetical protein
MTLLATALKLIPVAVLHKHEVAVLRQLDELPISYEKNLLDDKPNIRFAFLYYALLTHWPEWLNDVSKEELLYNRLYWFLRLANVYQKIHGVDAGYEQQCFQLEEMAANELDAAIVFELRDKVIAEAGTNEWEIAVSFSDFSIDRVLAQFRLQLDEMGDFFVDVAGVPISSLLEETLRENIPLALAMGTEKARSELIIAPMLIEIRRQLKNSISLFSGVEWNIDAAQGLRGQVDFLLCQSPHQLVLESPVVSVVEGKKEGMRLGMGQCLAEMVAARIFNEQRQNSIPVVFGIVTTGSTWKFLRLIDNTVHVDVAEYYITDVKRIIGIIVSMFR